MKFIENKRKIGDVTYPLSQFSQSLPWKYRLTAIIATFQNNNSPFIRLEKPRNKGAITE
jgi:hypothetical protein